jgi:hypothetical protein
MKDRTEEVYRANSDILFLLNSVSNIGWDSLREQSVHRILYISKVLYLFVYPGESNVFQDYSFSISDSGPFSELINSALTDLKSREVISEDSKGDTRIIDRNFEFDPDSARASWLKTIIYILGVYGESKIFNFIIRDPLYQEAVETNSQKALDTSEENTTIKVLNSFKNAFEETLETTSSIDKNEYLELYFEYIFSKIIKRED